MTKRNAPQQPSDNDPRNPYVSPGVVSGVSSPGPGGAAWGLLIGAMQGATFGALGGIVLGAVVSIFYAITRLPGWFGPSEGLAIRLGLYFVLCGMVGSVVGMAVGAVGGVIVGLIGAFRPPKTLPRAGATVFAIAGGMTTVLTWGREMIAGDHPGRVAAFAAAVLVGSAFGAAAGRRTGASIRRVVESLNRKRSLARLSGNDVAGGHENASD